MFSNNMLRKRFYQTCVFNRTRTYDVLTDFVMSLNQRNKYERIEDNEFISPPERR